MKNILFFIFAFATLQSCDDGDVIVTTFDFEDANLQLCNDGNQYVFYKINNVVSESISFQLTTNDTLFLKTATKEYPLDGTKNIVNYRRFNGDVTGDYFCSAIPPTAPTVDVDYTGASGTATVKTTTVLDDNDRINTDDEKDETDTDGDGILNYYDFDDDGDNVPTAVELGPDFPEEAPLDTDGDNIPDYLDPDDDDDGVFTIYEDANQNLNPQDDIPEGETVPNYLNTEIAETYQIQEFTEHTYSLNSDVSIRLSDLVLVKGEETIIRESLFLGTIQDVFVNNNVLVTPIFVAPEDTYGDPKSQPTNQ